MKWFCLFCLSFIAMNVHADLSFKQLAEVTDTPSQLEGDFEQTKMIKEFETSITSTGRFVYHRNDYIQWHTLSPIENTLLMTPEAISSKQGDDDMMQIDADKNPAIKKLSQIFFAVLTADWQQLSNFFTASGTLDNDRWQVTLAPKNNALEQAVNKVELAGDNLMREVTFYENNGDVTHILFSNLEQ